jgi:antitoxin component YwqK of YwqJK toxin-antitoxin module
MSGVLRILEVTYPTGELRRRFGYLLSPDGSTRIRHGRYVEYSRTGSLLAEGVYEHGLEEGDWKDFHENGRLAAEGRYVRGREEGVWRFWNERGEPEPEVTYRDGEEEP